MCSEEQSALGLLEIIISGMPREHRMLTEPKVWPGLWKHNRGKALETKQKETWKSKNKKLSIWILTPRIKAEEEMRNKREVRCSNQ